ERSERYWRPGTSSDSGWSLRLLELGVLGEDLDAVVRHVEEPGVDLGVDLIRAGLDLERTLPEEREEGRMAGQHAEFPVRGRDDDHVGVARPHLLLGRDDVHLELRALGHYAASSESPPSPASFLPASSASSMPPTM